MLAHTKKNKNINKKSLLIINKLQRLIFTDKGVSLFSITCKRWGGNIGGPETFCQGTDDGISWENPPKKVIWWWVNRKK